MYSAAIEIEKSKKSRNKTGYKRVAGRAKALKAFVDTLHPGQTFTPVEATQELFSEEAKEDGILFVARKVDRTLWNMKNDGVLFAFPRHNDDRAFRTYRKEPNTKVTPPITMAHAPQVPPPPPPGRSVSAMEQEIADLKAKVRDADAKLKRKMSEVISFTHALTNINTALNECDIEVVMDETTVVCRNGWSGPIGKSISLNQFVEEFVKQEQ